MLFEMWLSFIMGFNDGYHNNVCRILRGNFGFFGIIFKVIGRKSDGDGAREGRFGWARGYLNEFLFDQN